MAEYKPVRSKRGRLVHATNVDGYRFAACGRPIDGWILMADEIPTCKKCLRAILAEMDA